MHPWEWTGVLPDSGPLAGHGGAGQFPGIPDHEAAAGLKRTFAMDRSVARVP
jgi:hypothetical protein